MKVKIGTRGDIENVIYIYPKNKTKFPDKNIETFFKNSLTLKKDQLFAIEVLPINKGDKVYKNIIVKVNNLAKIDEYLEDLVGSICSIIKRLDLDFFLNMNNLDIKSDTKNLIEDFFGLFLYSFDKYKSKSNSNYSLTINSKRDKNEYEILINSINLTKDLTNEVANNLRPSHYVQKIEELYGKNKSVNIKVFDYLDLQKLGLNGIYEVGKGSSDKPCLVVLEYTPKKGELFGLVGKGITFDTGGYNLKPSGYLESMKLDMAGSATMLGIFNYFVANKLNKNLVVGIPLAENMISSDSYRPGDVIKMYNGKYVEVGNTDAEGRLLLADTLSFVEKKYKPKYMIDIATLTGAQMLATGDDIAAIVGKSASLNAKLQKLSWKLKERVWELPYFEKYFNAYSSEVADFASHGGGRAQPATIQAGLFLSKFVKLKNWIHIDMAGPVGGFTSKKEGFGYGASAFGVRLLINFIKSL